MDFSNHLTFQGSGKGITVPGPPDLDQMLQEFTISFWIYPTAFNAESYLLHAFERVHITASAANKLSFKYANSAGTFLQPVYTGNDLALNSWNYVAASLKEEKNPTLFAYLHQTLVLATSRNTAAILVGTKTDHPKPSYSHFRNSIVIGGFDEATPNSFSGSLRELKLFDTYHGEAQLIAEKVRMQKGYSYDDPHLVAYWKFDESYTATDLSFTVRDQSQYGQSLSITNDVGAGSSYPNFQTGTQINLCFFHDVATCITVDKSQGKLHPVAVGAYRYTKAPVFDIQSLPNYHTISEGDELHYVHVEGPLTNVKAKMIYSEGSWKDDPTLPVSLLPGGVHYMIYFYMSDGLNFPLAQVYPIKMMNRFEPADMSAFKTLGVNEIWQADGGDQAYGDQIRLSKSCEFPERDDFIITRTKNPDYPKTFINTV